MQAREALDAGEVPIGCVIVDRRTGKIVASGRNRTNETRDATRHAEFEALAPLMAAAASSGRQGDRGASDDGQCADLSHCTLYVTVEPCIMCAAALRRLSLTRVHFACYNDRFGGCGSVFDGHTVALSDPPLEVVVDRTHRRDSILLLRLFYLQENGRAPAAKKKARRTLKDFVDDGPS